jgi:hypothetical protein
MTPRHSTLEALQRWMLAVMTHPDGIAAGIGSAEARRQIDIGVDAVADVISPSSRQGSLERMAVYGNAYYGRLIECLRAEFPAVHQAVGEEAFRGLAFGFLQQFPPGSYTLGELGKNLPRSLEQTRPPRAGASPDWADFVIDLATLERTYSEVFDGPGEERLTPLQADRLTALAPGDWDRCRLQTAPSLRLLAVRFPVHEYVSAVRRMHVSTGVPNGKRGNPQAGAEPSAVAGEEDGPRMAASGVEFPAPRPTWLAVSRRQYVVRRRPLSPLGFGLLTRLQRGEPLGSAIAGALQDVAIDPEGLGPLLEESFRVWTRDGYFIGIVPDPDAQGRTNPGLTNPRITC